MGFDVGKLLSIKVFVVLPWFDPDSPHMRLYSSMLAKGSISV